MLPLSALGALLASYDGDDDSDGDGDDDDDDEGNCDYKSIRQWWMMIILIILVIIIDVKSNKLATFGGMEKILV